MKPESSSASASSSSSTAKSVPVQQQNDIGTSIIDISTNQSSDKLEKEQKIPIQYHRRHFINYTAYDQHLKETVLGICAAIIVFLFILTVFCATRRDPADYKVTQPFPLTHEQNTAILNEVYVDVKYDNKS